MPQRTPGPVRKLDAIAVLMGPLLPAHVENRSILDMINFCPLSTPIVARKVL